MDKKEAAVPVKEAAKKQATKRAQKKAAKKKAPARKKAKKPASKRKKPAPPKKPQRKYTEAERARCVKKMMEGVSANELSKRVGEGGPSQPTLSRWMREAAKKAPKAQKPQEIVEKPQEAVERSDRIEVSIAIPLQALESGPLAQFLTRLTPRTVRPAIDVGGLNVGQAARSG
jgi:hypothetical protein